MQKDELLKCRVPMWMGGLPAGHCGEEGLERALKEHHEWQMRFDLDDPEHGFNYAAEYADSGMCERTLAALTAYRSARP